MHEEALPEYRVTARNTSRTSENAIHHDDVARRYGFAGGLVPGVAVYAYLTRPLVAALGPAWLERGTASVRFVKPMLEGDAVTVTGAVTGRDALAVSASVTARVARGEECGVMTATLPAGSPTPVNGSLYPERPLPDPRPEPGREHWLAQDGLGTPVALYDEARAEETLGKYGDDLAVYRGPGARAHPAFYLEQANRALSANVRLGPWIHVGSVVRHLGAARVGETVRTLGRVRSVFEKKSREFVELDLLLVVGRRPVAHVLHTAIYRLPTPAA